MASRWAPTPNRGANQNRAAPPLTKGQSGQGIIQVIPRTVTLPEVQGAVQTARGVGVKNIPTAKPQGKTGTIVQTNTTAPAPVAPFLTPAQQQALSATLTTGSYNIAALNRKEGDATFQTNTELAAAQRTHDINTDNANSSLAARGLFQSSIRDGDLNDINVTLATRQNILNTTLKSLITDTNASIQREQGNMDTAQAIANGQMVANAQGVTPDLPVTTTSQVPINNGQPQGATVAELTKGLPNATINNGVINGHPWTPPTMPPAVPPPGTAGVAHPQEPGLTKGIGLVPKPPRGNQPGNNNRGIPGGGGRASGGTSTGVPSSGAGGLLKG